MSKDIDEEAAQAEGGPQILLISLVIGIIAMIGVFYWITKASESRLKKTGQYEKFQQDTDAIKADEAESAADAEELGDAEEVEEAEEEPADDGE